MNEEKVMEEEAFMQLNHKDMKKWYGENEELKRSEAFCFDVTLVDTAVFRCSGKI